MSRNVLTGLILAVASLAAGADEAALQKEIEEQARVTLEKGREKYQALAPVTIYGKVVDQAGNPIQDADVHIRWERALHLIRKIDYGRDDWVKSGADGRFEFICDHPHYASVNAVNKDGYEMTESPMRNLIWFRTAEKSPAVIVMRKRGELTFLISSPTSKWADELFTISGTGNVSRAIDLLAWNPDRKWRDSATTNADLRVDASFNAVSGQWNVTYSATNGSGIILSDKLLYEAPASGYGASASVAFSDSSSLNKYVYVKSREPVLFSCVRFEYSSRVGEHSRLTLFCKALINPYGDRTLEYDERSDSLFGLANGLASEAKAALAQGKYPERPDMAKRVEETREYLKEEEKRQKEADEARRKDFRRRQELGLGAYDPDPDLDEEGRKKLLEERRKLLNIPERRGPRSWGYP